ncbi:hypothetical protein [Marinicella rhabdoformis]|uniref:hypothetical protein n=1 Tax=Marinicella rhabdoformis TaxID=2580566 RepID=UPI0012AECF48|nr:hypothetical protein [Marinicella rhabdoformis]
MGQVDTNDAGKSLNLVGKVLFWLVGILFFVALMTLLSDQKHTWFLYVAPGALLWLTGCFFSGLAALKDKYDQR